MIPSSGCPPWPPDHPRTLPRTGTPTPPRGARPDLAHVRALFRHRIRGELFCPWIKGQDHVRTPVRHPHDVALIDINRVGLWRAAGQLPLRLRIVEPKLAGAPLADLTTHQKF